MCGCMNVWSGGVFWLVCVYIIAIYTGSMLPITHKKNRGFDIQAMHTHEFNL